jgi:hypothetical protein
VSSSLPRKGSFLDNPCPLQGASILCYLDALIRLLFEVSLLTWSCRRRTDERGRPSFESRTAPAGIFRITGHINQNTIHIDTPLRVVPIIILNRGTQCDLIEVYPGLPNGAQIFVVPRTATFQTRHFQPEALVKHEPLARVCDEGVVRLVVGCRMWFRPSLPGTPRGSVPSARGAQLLGL